MWRKDARQTVASDDFISRRFSLSSFECSASLLSSSRTSTSSPYERPSILLWTKVESMLCYARSEAHFFCRVFVYVHHRRAILISVENVNDDCSNPNFSKRMPSSVFKYTSSFGGPKLDLVLRERLRNCMAKASFGQRPQTGGRGPSRTGILRSIHPTLGYDEKKESETAMSRMYTASDEACAPISALSISHSISSERKCLRPA